MATSQFLTSVWCDDDEGNCAAVDDNKNCLEMAVSLVFGGLRRAVKMSGKAIRR